MFVNARNEWAEGAALESSRRFGLGNLAALGDLFGLSEELKCQADPVDRTVT